MEKSPIVSCRSLVLIFLRSESFAQSLQRALETNGCRSTIVTTESAALAEVRANVPSLIIVDRDSGLIPYLRHLQGISVVPIVAVEAINHSHPDEKSIEAYDEGIDLIVGNQSVRELTARVRAILRRRNTPMDSHTHLSIGHIRMDLGRHEVTVNGRAIELTPKEFQILKQFLESPSRVFSRQEMLNRVWGEGIALEAHVLDVHIHSLRQKIEQNPASPTLIVTVRGIGYKMRA